MCLYFFNIILVCSRHLSGQWAAPYTAAIYIYIDCHCKMLIDSDISMVRFASAAGVGATLRLFGA